MTKNFDPNLDEFINKLDSILAQSAHNPHFTIDSLCLQMTLSRSQLHRKIKGATGLSTTLYIRHFRLESAKMLLGTTERNISEIAYEVGFGSPQNFSKYFMEAYGISPSDYRKNLKTTSQQPEPVEDALPAKTKKFNRTIEVAAIAFFLGSIGWILYLLAPRHKPAEQANQRIAIAILPFTNLGPNEDDYFAKGIVEDILTHLSRFKNLRVISRTTSQTYEHTNKSVRQIARELNLDYLVEGSVRFTGTQVRVTVQLINAATDEHLWANNYDRSANDLIQLQTQVARQIAETLNQQLSPKLKEHFNESPTKSSEAYDAVLKGRYLLRNRQKEDVLESYRLFEYAIRLDSNYSDAYTGLASAATVMADIYDQGSQVSPYLEIAEENALKAIREDQQNANAYTLLANIYREKFKWDEANSSYQIALELNPNDAITNYWYALDLRQIGRLDEAITYHEIASELDPFQPVVNAGYIYTCIMAGRFDFSKQLLEDGRVLFKNSFLHSFVEGYLNMSQGRYEQAIPFFNKALDENPDFKTSQACLAYSYGRMGQRGKVVEYLRQLDPDDPSIHFRKAVAYLGLGENDQAIRQIKLAADTGKIPEELISEHIYKPILNDPTMQSILEQFGLLSYLNARTH